MPNDIRYAYTILYVKDVEASLTFYEHLLDMERKMITPEKDYGELSSGEVTLSFAREDLAHSFLKEGFEISAPNKKCFGIEMAFTTGNVKEAIEHGLSLGAQLVQAPEEKPWGQTVGYIRDLNGFLVEFCTPLNN